MKARRDDASLERALKSAATKTPSERARRCLFASDSHSRRQQDADASWTHVRSSSSGADHLQHGSAAYEDGTRSADNTNPTEAARKSRIICRSGCLPQRRTQSLSDSMVSSSEGSETTDPRLQHPVQEVADVREFMSHISHERRFFPIKPPSSDDDDDDPFDDPLADDCSSLCLNDDEINNNRILSCPSNDRCDRQTTDLAESSSVDMELDLVSSSKNTDLVGRLNAREEESDATLTRPALYGGLYKFTMHDEADSFQFDTNLDLIRDVNSDSTTRDTGLISDFQSSLLDHDLQIVDDFSLPLSCLVTRIANDEVAGLSETRLADSTTTLHNNTPISPQPPVEVLATENFSSFTAEQNFSSDVLSRKRRRRSDRPKDSLHCGTRTSSSHQTSLIASHRRRTLPTLKFSRPKSDETEGSSLKKTKALRFCRHRRSTPADRKA